MTLRHYAVHIHDAKGLSRVLREVIELSYLLVRYELPQPERERISPAVIRETAKRIKIARQTLDALLAGRLTRVRVKTWARLQFMLDDAREAMSEMFEEHLYLYRELREESRDEHAKWGAFAKQIGEAINNAERIMASPTTASVPSLADLARGRAHSARYQRRARRTPHK